MDISNNIIPALLLVVTPMAVASEPPSFLIDKGVCPFEACTYGSWTAGKPVSLHSNPKEDSQVVGTIDKGESVQALTGEVHVIPTKFVVSKLHGKYTEGDVLWVYTYQGEGMYKVWYQGGNTVEELEPIPVEGSTCAETPLCWGELDGELQSTWWVQVKTSDGTTGWTTDTQHFTGRSMYDIPPQVASGAPDDRIEIKDGSTLVGALKDAKVPFTSSFGSVEVDIGQVRSFGEGKLTLADGSVLKGQFDEHEIAISTSYGELTIQAQDIVRIARDRRDTTAPVTSEQPTAGQGVLSGRVIDNFGAPVRDAMVRIQGSAFTTTTDQDGRYELRYVPGAILVQVASPRYDPTHFNLNLSEPARYPVEDKRLLRLPARKGMFYRAKAGWTPLTSCSLKQTRAIGGKIDYAGVRKDTRQVSGAPIRIPSGGQAVFFDYTQSGDKLLIYRVDSNDEIITKTRGGGLGGFAATLNPGRSQKGTSFARYGKKQLFPGRDFYFGNFQPGMYAIVDRSYKKTCFKFQVGDVAAPTRQPAEGTPSEAKTLSVDGKSVSYWRSPSHEKHALFRFGSNGYQNTYRLDCENKRFRWTENVRVSTGKVTGSSAGAEWRPMNPKSTISNAVYDAVCPKTVPREGKGSNKTTSSHFEGIWKGTGFQSNSNESWTIKATIARNLYSIDYPSLGCGGTLNLISHDASHMRFKETLTYGKAKCVNNGETVIAKAGNDSARYSWFFPNGKKGATGTLSRK